MKKHLFIFLLKLMRYKPDFKNIPSESDKCVIVFAPHTSWRDFVIGYFFMNVLGVKASFLIKKSAFKFPLGGLLRNLGGIPVEKGNHEKFTNYVSDIIKREDQMAILICPEGTRKLVKKWRKGFYTIAQKADVPIVLGYIDYNTRKCGMGPVYHITGDYEHDLHEIQKFYFGMRGRRKGLFHLENMKPEESVSIENPA
ncbi:MAG TPA: 1-acyl-sn-glycerol-3-phosphate acyltransferase [Bacteroidales bacterium]|nr:1-acyl-sn-glycerol-3-phosphate acyltransferase [Bacteroidales bacterium]